eukprot:scaffold2.g7106.t1
MDRDDFSSLLDLDDLRLGAAASSAVHSGGAAGSGARAAAGGRGAEAGAGQRLVALADHRASLLDPSAPGGGLHPAAGIGEPAAAQTSLDDDLFSGLQLTAEPTAPTPAAPASPRPPAPPQRQQLLPAAPPGGWQAGEQHAAPAPALAAAAAAAQQHSGRIQHQQPALAMQPPPLSREASGQAGQGQAAQRQVPAAAAAAHLDRPLAEGAAAAPAQRVNAAIALGAMHGSSASPAAAAQVHPAQPEMPPPPLHPQWAQPPVPPLPLAGAAGEPPVAAPRAALAGSGGGGSGEGDSDDGDSLGGLSDVETEVESELDAGGLDEPAALGGTQREEQQQLGAAGAEAARPGGDKPPAPPLERDDPGARRAEGQSRGAAQRRRGAAPARQETGPGLLPEARRSGLGAGGDVPAREAEANGLAGLAAEEAASLAGAAADSEQVVGPAQPGAEAPGLEPLAERKAAGTAHDGEEAAGGLEAAGGVEEPGAQEARGSEAPGGRVAAGAAAPEGADAGGPAAPQDEQQEQEREEEEEEEEQEQEREEEELDAISELEGPGEGEGGDAEEQEEEKEEEEEQQEEKGQDQWQQQEEQQQQEQEEEEEFVSVQEELSQSASVPSLGSAAASPAPAPALPHAPPERPGAAQQQPAAAGAGRRAGRQPEQAAAEGAVVPLPAAAVPRPPPQQSCPRAELQSTERAEQRGGASPSGLEQPSLTERQPGRRPERQRPGAQQPPDGAALLEAAALLECGLAVGAAQGAPAAAAAAAAAPRRGSSEGDASYHKDLLVASLVSQLDAGGSPPAGAAATSPGAAAGAGWGEEEGHANVVGAAAAARAFISHSFEQLFRGQAAAKAGVPTVVAKLLGIVAVGTSGGSTHVLLPAATGPGGGAAGVRPRLLEVAPPPERQRPQQQGGGGGGADAVTAVCLGQHDRGLLLLVGHASGVVRLWELKLGVTGGGMHFSLARAVGGAHGAAVTAAAVLGGGPGQATWALTCDAHGRLMAHNVGRLLSVAAQALTTFARGLTGGGGGPSASHLITLQVGSGASTFDPGDILSIQLLHAGLASPAAGSPGGGGRGGGRGPPAAAADAAAADAAGVAAQVPDAGHCLLLCASRAVLVALLSQEGRLTILHVFLPPHNTPPATVPYAAWRLAGRHAPAAAPGGAGAGRLVALVAVAWGAHVSVYQVALWNPHPQQQQQQQRGAAGGGGQPPSPPPGRRGAGPAPGPPPAGGEAPAPAPLPPPALLRGWEVEEPVCGACFLDSGPLAVVRQAGDTAVQVLMYLPSAYLHPARPAEPEAGAGAGIESLALRDWLVPSRGLAAAGGAAAALSPDAFHHSVSGYGEQALLLTSGGVRVLQQLTWQQRLSALVGRGRLEAALLAAVRAYHAAAGDSGGGGGGWPADGAGADPGEVSRQLLTVLCCYLDQGLAQLGAAATAAPPAQQQPRDGAGAAGAGAAPAAARLAATAVACCLLLGAPESLFGDVFPRFQAAGRGCLAAFLSELVPHVLADQLPSLAPEVGGACGCVEVRVMQALVEHYVALGQPEQVERIVLHLDILSLDLNQLIPLCVAHGLSSALLHIFTRALQDWQTPAALLLVAAAAAAEAEQAAAEGDPGGRQAAEAAGGGGAEAAAAALQSRESLRLGYKLLLFLRCCLLGVPFPPPTPSWAGAAGAPPAHAASLPPAQQHQLRLQAALFLLHSTCLSVWECWRLWGEAAHSEAAAAVARLPALIEVNQGEPYPALRFLCWLDAPTTLEVLRHGLEGWDALQSDLAEAAPEVASRLALAPAGGGGGSTVTQASGRDGSSLPPASLRLSAMAARLWGAVVDAVVVLLEGGAFAARGPGAQQQPQGQGQGQGAEHAALTFLAVHLAASRAVVPPRLTLRVLEHLAPPATAAGAAAEPPPPPPRQPRAQGRGRAEAAAADAAAAARVSLAAPLPREQREAIFIDVATHAAGGMGALERQQAVWLARAAGLRRAEGRLRHLEGAWAEALACLAADGAHPAAAFEYACELLGGAAGAEAAAAAAAAVVAQAPALVALDAAAAADLALGCLSLAQQQALLQALAPAPDLQFGFLRAVVEAARRAPRAAAAAAAGRAQQAAVEPLLRQMGVANQYVALLCAFDPGAVLPFLQSHGSYGVDDCLRACAEHGVQDAAAFLLERRGDVQSALAIRLDTVRRTNARLVGAGREGALDALQLAPAPAPAPAPARGARAPAPAAAAAAAAAARHRRLASYAGLLAGRADPALLPLLRQASAGGGLLPPSSPSAAAAAAAAAGSLPPELRAAREALAEALSMCLRFWQDRVVVGPAGGGAGAAAPAPAAAAAGDGDGESDPAQQLWFQVLQCYVGTIRELRREEQQQGASSPGEGSGGGGGGPPPPDLAQRRERLLLLQGLFTGFMEEVIGAMAGHVPLQRIAHVVIREYGSDPLGNFKSTLLGLLGACAFELSLLRCANRVMGADGVAILSSGYRKCSAALPLAAAGDAGADGGGGAQGGGAPGGGGGGGLGLGSGQGSGLQSQVADWVQRGSALGSEVASRAAAAAAAGGPSARLLRLAGAGGSFSSGGRGGGD